MCVAGLGWAGLGWCGGADVNLLRPVMFGVCKLPWLLLVGVNIVGMAFCLLGGWRVRFKSKGVGGCVACGRELRPWTSLAACSSSFRRRVAAVKCPRVGWLIQSSYGLCFSGRTRFYTRNWQSEKVETRLLRWAGSALWTGPLKRLVGVGLGPAGCSQQIN